MREKCTWIQNRNLFFNSGFSGQFKTEVTQGLVLWKIVCLANCTVNLRISDASIGSGNIQQLLVTFLCSPAILKINRNRLSSFEEKHCHKHPQKYNCTLLSRSLKENFEVCTNGDNGHICQASCWAFLLVRTKYDGIVKYSSYSRNFLSHRSVFQPLMKENFSFFNNVQSSISYGLSLWFLVELIIQDISKTMKNIS